MFSFFKKKPLAPPPALPDFMPFEPPAEPAPPAPAAPIPLANGDGAIGVVWTTDKGESGSGLTAGTRTFNPSGGLVELSAAGKGKKLFEKGVTVDPGADGIVAWGRWTNGESKVKDAAGKGDGRTTSLHYVAFAGQPLLPVVVGSFSSFASTAPTVSKGGQLVAVGEVNSARGSVSVALLSLVGGSANYSLVVPVAGQTFSLVGQATQVSTFGFSGVSDIRSTGTGCDGGCTGSLGNNVSVIGLVGGAAGNRAGINYGFDSRIGNVSGVIVFKR